MTVVRSHAGVNPLSLLSVFFSPVALLPVCLSVLSVCTMTLQAILIHWFYLIEKMALGFRTKIMVWIKAGSKC